MSNAIVENGIIAKGAYAGLNSSMDATKYVQALTKKDIFGKQDFTAEQAEAFAGVEKTGEVIKGIEQYRFITKDKVDANGNIVYDNDGKAMQEKIAGYTIVDSYTDPTTGYSGVLFKDNVTGKYTIANRGTEMTSPEDLGDDVTLYNQQVPEQFASLSTFMKQLIDSGTIKQTDDITMSGHSLGGALTQMGTAAYSDYVDQAYTYNSPGVKDLITHVSAENGKYYYQEFTGHYDNATGVPIFSNKYEITKDVYDAFYDFAHNKDNPDIASKLLNIKASEGNSIISDLGIDIGSELSVPGSTHSIVDLIETLVSLGDELLQSNKKDIIITLEDASANEQEGYISFKISINETLDKDFSFKVQSIDGSATGGSDYEAQNANVVTIKAGSKEIIHKIPIASDGIYEKSEEFMLYAYSQADSYSGYDLGKVTFEGTALGTITDTKAPQSCPAPITPDFGFDFDVPLAPVVSAGGGHYSSGGGGGGSYYYTGRTSSAPRVYNPSTPTITPPQPLPNVPVYECHYTLELSSVALVTLPTACSTPPLVLDLNRDGITSLSLATSLALFDYDNDGVKEHTAWIQNSDALLVRDINDDGVISDGSELFGDKTPKQDGTLANDGYDALKEYDTNDDGVVNSLDDKFNELKLWMDDGDGITQEGELHTLTQENITSISLPTTTMTPIKENGNTITNTSTYTKDDGTLGDVKDIWFEYENIAEETYFDMDGDGFAEKMETWMEANQGVLVWDKNGDGIINSGKEILSNHMLLPNGKTLSDSFSGLNAFDTNKDGVIDTQDSAGLAIWKDTNKNGQTDAGELLAFGDENSLQSINLNPYQNMLSGYDRNHDMKLNSSDAIYNYMYEQENADGSITLYLPNNAAAKNMLGDYSGVESIETSQGTKTLKEVIFYTGELTLNDTLQGTTKNDKLIGNRRSNYLFGGDGRDIIEANDGNDTLEGGRGDDWLKGGNGNDVYVFGKGDGVDVIEDSSGTDVLKLKEGVTQEDLVLKKSGSDLIIGIKEDGKSFLELSDKVVLKNWYQTNNINSLSFSDGTVANMLDILQDISTDEDMIDSTTAIKYAMKFDGKDDAIVVRSSTNNELNVSTALSLVATFSYEKMENSTAGMIVSKHFTHYSRSYDLSIGSDGKLIFDTIDSANNTHIISSNTTLKTDQTYTVVATYDQTTGISQLYIDGVLDKELNVGSFNIMQTSVPVVIGAYCYSNNGSSVGSYFKGVIDEVQIYNKALSPTEIATLATNNTSSNGLMAHYDFEENIVNNKSGNEYDEVVYGNPEFFTNINQNILNNQVLQLNGIENKVSTTQIISSAKTGEQVSVSFEMNWDGTDSTMPIGFYYYDLWIKDGCFGFNTGNGDIYGIADNTFLNQKWHTITAIFTQGNVSENQLYIDGVKQTLSQVRANGPLSSYANISDTLNLGSWHTGGGYGFKGKLDNVQLHNRALTQDEVSLISKKEVVNDGLVAYYDFEGDVPYADKSGNGHTAVASGNVSIVSDTQGSLSSEALYDNDYENITVDNELWVDNIKTLSESGLEELVLQTGYTGAGTGGTTAKTTTEGDGFVGTLENVWLKRNTLDTKYTYEGEISEEVQELPDIGGSGNVRDMQHVMQDNQTLADTVNAYKEQSSEKSFGDLDDEMNDILAQWVQMDNFGGTVQTTPPLVLDLNANGITSTSLEGSNAYFDYDGDGRRELTAWIEAEDGLLVVDNNNNGIVDTASELFGTYMQKADGSYATDGYDALRQYDSNGDNVVDANDEKFDTLQIWQDTNQNGKSEVGELKTLIDAGVSSLSLDVVATEQLEYENTISGVSSFTKSDGQTGMMRDIWFSYSDKHSIAVSELSDEDEKKLAIVESFLGKQLSASERANPYIVSNVLEQYNTLKYDTMAKMFSNKLFGEDFPSCQFMYDALNNTLARIASGNSNETETTLAINLVAAVLKRNTTDALLEIDHIYLNNTEIKNLLAQRDIAIDFVNEKIIGHVGSHYYGTSNGETFDVSSFDGATVEAKNGNDVLVGSTGRDKLYGGGGNDIIRGNGGVDILSGRQGNDLLIGGEEQSVYEYYLGDGHDIIYDQGGKNDILRFAYLEPNDLKIEKSGADMLIKIKSPNGTFDNPFGSITIKNGYTTGKIEQFYFASGIYSLDDLSVESSSDTSYLYDKNDGKLVIDDIGGNDKVVFGENVSVSNIKVKQIGDDLVIGLAFEERAFEELPDQLSIKNFFLEQNRIESFVFQDGTVLNYETILTIPEEEESDGIIRGDEDDNYLIGDENNNIFNGGAGNDTLEGKSGDDYYIFGKGSGKDIITDNAGVDSILMGLDITRQDILAKIVGDDITFALKEEGKSFEELSDSITIKNYNQVGFEVEKIVLDDGTTYAIEDLLNQAPILENETEELTLQDTRSITQTFTVTDPDGDTLNYTLKTAPLHGELIFNEEGSFTYSATDKFIGIDSAVVSIDDGNGGVVEQTLNFDLSVSAPTITTASKTLAEDSILSDVLHVSNPVGGILTYEVMEDVNNGSFTLNPDGSYEYIPDVNYNGNDTITIKVTNEYGLSTVKTIDLDITSVNDLPELSVDTMNLTLQDIRTIDGQVEATDIDGDTLNYTLKTAPLHGELIFNEEGSFTYSATDKFIGIDSAVVSIDDGNGGVVEQTLNFNLSVSAPTLETTSVALDEDTTLTNSLHVNNPIGGELSYEIVEASGNGSFSLDTDGSYAYSPFTNYNGLDTVTIKVTNEYGLSSTQTLNLNITPINDAPELTEDTLNYTLKNIRVVQGQVEATDPDGDTLSYTVTTQANHGVVSVDAEGNWSYKADGSYNGSDSALISIDDGNGGVVTQTLNFEIQGYIYEGEDLVIDDTINDTLDISNLSKDDLSFKQSGDDLLITLLDANTITLKNYFTDTNAGVEKLITKEGEINLTRDAINESRYGGYIALDSQDHLIIGDEYSNWLIGNGGDDILLGGKQYDYISGGAGDDILVGGEDNDNLQGNSGDDQLYGDSGNDQLYGGEGSDTLSGGEGADMLFGENGDDAISGGSGHDTIYAGNGDDTLKGGTGDDFIDGSYGNDTYLFNIGDGADTIVDTAAYGSNDTDTLILGEGITKENLHILRDNYDLILQVSDTDSVRVKYWFSSNQRNTLEQISFSDGTTLNTQEVNALALTKGTQNNDWLFGLNDLGDNLYGMEGNDRLYSYGGDDFLSGGEGDDFMEGGSGSDTYTFSKGDGADTINEWKYWNDTDIDTISFTQDVSKEDISFMLSGTDLLIQYSNEDTIKVANTYNHTTAPIERLELSDGSYLTNDTINRIIQEINAYATDKGMTNLTNDTIKSNQDLMQIVSSGWQSA